MKIVVCQFDYDNSDVYDRLTKVFEYSVRKNAPNINLEILELPSQKTEKGKVTSFTANTLKLDIWNDIMASAKEPIIFCDADLLLLRDPSSAFDSDFDICLTKRSAKIPFNGGVVFAKPTDESKEFFQLWKEANRKMYDDNVLHREWRAKYAGMNQASLGYILELGCASAKIEFLPCATWNACDEDWEDLREDAVFIHIKGRLRAAILANKGPLRDYHKKAGEMWRNYDVQMRTEKGLPLIEHEIPHRKERIKEVEPEKVRTTSKSTFVRKPPSKPRFVDPQ
jgi:hypothetical protein